MKPGLEFNPLISSKAFKSMLFLYFSRYRCHRRTTQLPNEYDLFLERSDKNAAKSKRERVRKYFLAPSLIRKRQDKIHKIQYTALRLAKRDFIIPWLNFCTGEIIMAFFWRPNVISVMSSESYVFLLHPKSLKMHIKLAQWNTSCDLTFKIALEFVLHAVDASWNTQRWWAPCWSKSILRNFFTIIQQSRHWNAARNYSISSDLFLFCCKKPVKNVLFIQILLFRL